MAAHESAIPGIRLRPTPEAAHAAKVASIAGGANVGLGAGRSIDEKLAVMARRRKIKLANAGDVIAERLSFSSKALGRSTVSRRSVIEFQREFAAMVEAGVSIQNALTTLATQASDTRLSAVLRRVNFDMHCGASLPAAMAKHKGVFGPLDIASIESSPAAGELGQCLKRLADHHEQGLCIRSMTNNIKHHTAFFAAVSFVVAMAFLGFVIPVFEAMFEDFGGQLPGPTQMIVDLSDLVLDHWFLLIVAAVGTVVGVSRLLRNERVATLVDVVLDRMPIVGKVRRNLATAKFSAELRTLTANRVPMPQALIMAAAASDHLKFKKAAAVARADVERGMPLGQALAKTRAFPEDVCRTILAGEAADGLEKMLTNVTQAYAEKCEWQLGRITVLMAPTWMLSLGLALAYMTISMYLPMFCLCSIVG
ncbi:type II secretion system F family protein [bacterium]|nr:type II secretion system F family protein [bacterium]